MLVRALENHDSDGIDLIPIANTADATVTRKPCQRTWDPCMITTRVDFPFARGSKNPPWHGENFIEKMSMT